MFNLEDLFAEDRIYFVKEYGEKDEGKICRKVHQLKPYFSEKKILDTIAKLGSKVLSRG